MVQYNCNNCLKEFNHKGSYTRHLNRINPCKKLENECVNYSKDGISIPKQEYIYIN